MLAVFGWIMWGLINIYFTGFPIIGIISVLAWSGRLGKEGYMFIGAIVATIISWYFFFVNSPFVFVGS